MTRQILIIGQPGLKANTKAIAWLVQTVRDVDPCELIAFHPTVTLLDELREVYAGPIGAHAGEFESRHKVTALPAMYDVAPGWISMHGGDVSLSRIAGNTAMGAARKFNKSVVMGHTQRRGIVSETKGLSQLIGMEVGNCEQGCGLLTVDAQSTTVTPDVLVNSKRPSGSTVKP